ncbi:hypothetical protein ACJX0J_035688, partial [Zea mays]
EEVKPGATVSCKVGDGLVIHLSQAALGEPKKASENAIVSVKIDDKKLVLGTLSVEKHPQISCDLVFDKDFELSHNSKTASVFFCGYKSPVPLSDEEVEPDLIPMQNNEIKISTAKVPVKVGIQNADEDETSSGDDDDFTDSDSEMSEEDESSDEDEVSSDTDTSDDSGSEEQTPTPKKTEVVVGKKRAIEAETPSGKKAKSEQSAQKTGDKVSTSHPAKQSSKTPADKSTKTPTADKKSPKSGSHACKSCS